MSAAAEEVHEGRIRSAGFRKVLYVEPRDVYLLLNTCKNYGIAAWSELEGCRDAPLVIQAAIRDFERAEEDPDIGVGPVDDWVDSFEAWPVRVSHVAEGECR